MSEKRFEVSFDEKRIFDIYAVNKNTTEYDIHKSCDLINSLYEENEQLKSARRNDAKEFYALFRQNFGLKRENEFLKMENEEHKALIEKRWGEYMQKKFKENEE